MTRAEERGSCGLIGKGQGKEQAQREQRQEQRRAGQSSAGVSRVQKGRPLRAPPLLSLLSVGCDVVVVLVPSHPLDLRRVVLPCMYPPPCVVCWQLGKSASPLSVGTQGFLICVLQTV